MRRFRWAPPVASAEELGRLTEGAIRRRGRETATALERLGVDVDLAPVADVPGRPRLVHRRAAARLLDAAPRGRRRASTAFAAGLLDGGVAPTLKHFPGLGLATVSTDETAVTIDAARRCSPGARAVPARDRGGGRPARDGLERLVHRVRGRPAAWSPRVLALLRGLGFRGATVTDALEALATTHGTSLDGGRDPGRRGGCRPAALRRARELDGEGVRRAARRRALRAGCRAPTSSGAPRRIDELAATYAG